MIDYGAVEIIMIVPVVLNAQLTYITYPRSLARRLLWSTPQTGSQCPKGTHQTSIIYSQIIQPIPSLQCLIVVKPMTRAKFAQARAVPALMSSPYG